MSRAEILEHIRRMPELEKRDLVEQIWREFGAGSGPDDELSDVQAAELDRRLAEYEANPGDGFTWQEVAQNIEKRFGWKVP